MKRKVKDPGKTDLSFGIIKKALEETIAKGGGWEKFDYENHFKNLVKKRRKSKPI